MGSDGKIHFVNSGGADTALNFSKGLSIISVQFWIYQEAGGRGTEVTQVVTQGAQKLHINSVTGTDNNIVYCRVTRASDSAVIFEHTGTFSNVDLTLDKTTFYYVTLSPRYYGYSATFDGVAYI